MTSLFLSPIALYVGKMLLISAILSGYYWLFLRNASFHPYNRWYLLGSVVLSLALPIFHFPSPVNWISGEHYTRLLVTGNTIGSAFNGTPEQALKSSHGNLYAWIQDGKLLSLLYILVAILLLLSIARSLLYLIRLSRKYPSTIVKGIRFFQTEEPRTPFSFLGRLFWNKDLDVSSIQGQFIFRHELYHILQRHSLDILALTMIRSLFWCNPFFHWMMREMRVIHEFLADRYAVSSAVAAPSVAPLDERSAQPAERAMPTPDRYRYAEWLVWQSAGDSGAPGAFPPSPGSYHRLTHSFFQTHLKRRINMITQSNRSRPRYISRVLVLPLLIFLFCFFAARPSAGQNSGTKATEGDTRKPNKFPMNPVARHFLRALKYPQAALDEQKEGIIWFSVQIGQGNQLLSFKPYDASPNKTGPNAFVFTVRSLPSTHPSEKNAADNGNTAFVAEARAASEKIPADTASLTPGEYYFTARFKIEKPNKK